MTVDAKYIMSAAIAGLVSAFALMSAFSGGLMGLILGIASPFALFFVAITAGLTGTVIAAAVGFALVALMTPAIISAGLYLFGVCCAPVIMAWRMERETGFGPQTRLSGDTIGKIIGLTALIGGGMFAFALLNAYPTLSDPVDGALGLLRQTFFASIDQIAAGSQMPNAEVLQAKAQFDALGPLVFGGIGALWLFIAAVNASLAAMFAKKLGRFGGADIAQLRLVRWFAFPVGASFILGFSAGPPGLAFTGLSITLFAAVLLQGLSVVHVFSKQLPLRGLLLAIVYIACVFSPLKILLVLLGVADTRLNLRARRAGA